jgi:hypothetical protein
MSINKIKIKLTYRSKNERANKLSQRRGLQLPKRETLISSDSNIIVDNKK